MSTYTDRINFTCPKCSHGLCEVGELRAAGGFWSKIFDVQGHKYSTVTCSQCKYTELFKTDSSKLGNVFDFLTRR
jgi:predicted nucleic-acid-binding Zn-ribbon protein